MPTTPGAPTPQPIARQLAEELHLRLALPCRSLLGHDIADLIDQRLNARIDAMAALLAGGDRNEAGELVIDIMTTLDNPTPEWWATPLGRAVARSTGDTEYVSAREAASILQVDDSQISRWVKGGRLARTEHGIALLDVLAIPTDRPTGRPSAAAGITLADERPTECHPDCPHVTSVEIPEIHDGTCFSDCAEHGAWHRFPAGDPRHDRVAATVSWWQR